MAWNSESISEDSVRSNMFFKQQFKPGVIIQNSDCNDGEGKRVRKILTTYFDPQAL